MGIERGMGIESPTDNMDKGGREYVLVDLRSKLEKLNQFDFLEDVSLVDNYNALMELCEGNEAGEKNKYEVVDDNLSPEEIMELLMQKKDEWEITMEKAIQEDDGSELSQLFYVDIPSAKDLLLIY